MPQRAGRGLAPRVRDVVVRVERIASVALLGSVFTAVVLQVFFRYVLRSPLPWTDEVARYSLVWLTFAAAALVAAGRRHLAVHLAVPLGPRPARIVLIAVDVVVAATCLLMTWLAASMAIRWSNRTSTVLHIPMWLVVAAMFAGFALMAAHAIADVVRHARMADDEVRAEFGDSSDEVRL